MLDSNGQFRGPYLARMELLKIMVQDHSGNFVMFLFSNGCEWFWLFTTILFSCVFIYIYICFHFLDCQDELLNQLIDYYDRFGCRTCCFADLSQYIDLLNDGKRREVSTVKFPSQYYDCNHMRKGLVVVL